MEEVALYLHLFGHLPDNYITKNEAKDLGWVNSEGNLDEVAPGKSIGGDRFGNYEGQLPEKKGRKYRFRVGDRAKWKRYIELRLARLAKANETKK